MSSGRLLVQLQTSGSVALLRKILQLQFLRSGKEAGMVDPNLGLHISM